MHDVPKYWEVVREFKRVLDKQRRLIKYDESNLLEHRTGQTTELYHGRVVLSEDMLCRSGFNLGREPHGTMFNGSSEILPPRQVTWTTEIQCGVDKGHTPEEKFLRYCSPMLIDR